MPYSSNDWRLKRKRIMNVMHWDDYDKAIYRLYHEEKLSSTEIAQRINDRSPVDFAKITPRAIQRTVRSFGLRMTGTPGTRSIGDAFRLAVSKDRVKWAFKLNKVRRTRLQDKRRYMVLRRDGFRCQLCGATASDALLEVDHIITVADGGSNDTSNLRTLCHGCNIGRHLTEQEDASHK